MTSAVAGYQVLIGDALEQLRTLPESSVQCVVTSPPYYGLRNYGVAGQIGLEKTPAEYVAKLVAIFREVKRVLRDDGTLWLNLGDSYVGTSGNPKSSPCKGPNSCVGPTAAASMPMMGRFRTSKGKRIVRGSGRWGGGNTAVKSLKPKDLMGIPWRVAFALQDDGWYLRSDIIWAKGNAMPESVTDRPTRSHEYVFLFAKKSRYYYDAKAIAEPAVVGDNGSYFDKGKTGRVHAHQGRDKRDKQRLVENRTDAGFNDRWDAQSTHGKTRNRRDVWHINTQPYPGSHFAVFPEKLVELMILAGSPTGSTVLDPFAGSGTTLAVANRLGRHAIGIELSPAYARLIEQRCAQPRWILGEGEA